MKGCCYIVGAGSLYQGDLPFDRRPEDLVIAADGGYEYLLAAGMEPDLLIGDFDSMNVPAATCETIRLPVEKDDTDIAFGIKEGFARGYTRFVVYGGLGGDRLSHTLANIQLLQYIRQNGGTGTLIGGTTKLFLVGSGDGCEFPARHQGTLSVFSVEQEATVTLMGLQYPLTHATLHRAFPLGVSNHFVGERATVTVHSGTVLVVVEQ